MLNKTPTKQFFPALTGFRVIAAWIIFVYHFFPFKNSNHSYPKWIADIIWEFHIGVDMFFVLSGFLITYRYFDRNPIHFKKYMVNRFARIYPMYFIITAIGFGITFINMGWNKELTIQAILSFTMTKTLFADYAHSGISQGWTLTIEELFYISAPFYFILIRKIKGGEFLILPILIFVFGTFISYIFKDINNIGGFMKNNFSVYIIEFFAGIALALFMRKYTPKLNFITYLGIFSVILYILGIPHLREFPFFKTDIGRFIETGFLSFFGIAPFFWGLIYEKTLISKILSLPIMILLGKSSYVFYLIHKGFIPIFIDEYIWDNKLFLFIILNLISIILFKYIEEPANHWIKSQFKK